MRAIGFSTGALAKGDFQLALDMLRDKGTEVLELSALRQNELPALVSAIDELDLSTFPYVSVHAPSSIRPGSERDVVEQLQVLADRNWPIIIHPDAINDFSLWLGFGVRLCVENMDLRKPTGRTVGELEHVFSLLPEASFCCDLGHARQVDPTMAVATTILEKFGTRLRQLHVSEVNAKSTHDRISFASIRAFARIYHLIPDHIPVILETPVSPADIESEIAQARIALPTQKTIEGSLDIFWSNYQDPISTPQYRLHFLRYAGFRDGAQRSKLLVGNNALKEYLGELHIDDRLVQVIITKVQEDKTFDAPNVMMPSEYAIAYQQ